MKILLELQNVEVRYNAVLALKGISLSIKEGEIACLIGANGSGKSTLLKSIVGLKPISKGRILFNGEVISESINEEKQKSLLKLLSKNRALKTNRIISKGISLVPEGRGVFADLSVMENLEMGAFLVEDRSIIKHKTDEIYELFPILKDRRKQKAGSLSGGEQQMLAVARSMMNSPHLLLLDEPGLGLAPLVIRDIFETIVKINREENVTIFLVEQNARMALQVSSKGYVMETGNIVLEDDSKSLLKNPRVKAAYLGE